MNIEDYKKSIGAQRFRRTKEEIALGLSPEQALTQRLAADGVVTNEPSRPILGLKMPKVVKDTGQARYAVSPKTNPCLEIELPGSLLGPATHRKARHVARKGDIVIRIQPEKGVDADYFEQVPTEPIVIDLNNSWYSWFDTKAVVPYNGDVAMMLKHILEKGIGEVLIHFNTQEDITEYERPVKTPEQLKESVRSVEEPVLKTVEP